MSPPEAERAESAELGAPKLEYEQTPAERRACHVAGLALYLLKRLEADSERKYEPWWYGAADAAHGVLPGVYGMRAAQTEDVFRARIIAAYDLVDEACEEGERAPHPDHSRTAVLLGIARDALDPLIKAA